MPNTINPAILRQRYLNLYNKPTTLTTKQIATLWAKTSQSTNRGQNVTRTTLESRANTTLDLIHNQS